MEDVFVSFLTSLGLIGKIIIILIFGCPILWGAFIAVKKGIEAYNKRIEDNTIKKENDEKFHNMIKDMGDAVTSIQASLNELANKQQSIQTEMNDKITSVHELIRESQRDSKDGDIALENQVKTYDTTLSDINAKLSVMDSKTNLLIESDRENIKAFITEKYYKALDDKYIEPRIMQSLESIYEKYLQENGNTFIGSLMEDMRKMPHVPPTE